MERKAERPTQHHSYEEESSKDNEEEDSEEVKEIKEVTKIGKRKQTGSAPAVFLCAVLARFARDFSFFNPS